MKHRLLSTFAVAALAALPLASRADTEIVPLSYSFAQATDCGSYCYHDDGGKQLIDGAYGRAGWAVNIGNGNAYEWVGWYRDSVVNIDFDFGATKHVDLIKVGSTQDNLGDVVLPSVNVYQWSGAAWSLAGSLSVPPSSSNNISSGSAAAHGFLSLSGLNINSSKVRVSLVAEGPWTFADEVDFYASAAPVPEPETYAMMLAGLGLLGAVARRRKSRQA